jgi:hypothetical protein
MAQMHADVRSGSLVVGSFSVSACICVIAFSYLR